MNNRTKKIIKIIKLKNHNINGPSTLIKVTKDNKIVLVSFYMLFILNFINNNLLICDFG